MTEHLMQLAISLLATLASFGMVKLRRWATKYSLEQEAVNILFDAVASTQEQFVTFTKRAASDGKLSKEERQEMRTKAINMAFNLAKSDSVRIIIQSWTTEKVGGLIRLSLKKMGK